MKTRYMESWRDLQAWIEEEKITRGTKAYRGQSDASWQVGSSLARYFRKCNVLANNWRDRELKMYWFFRERMVRRCPGYLDKWCPLCVVGMMQHHSIPTRLIDFTLSPEVAAYFALVHASGNSAIWVKDVNVANSLKMEQQQSIKCLPQHIPEYQRAVKDDSIYMASPVRAHARVSAQRGCFLVQGRISPAIDDRFFAEKIVLDENLVIEGLAKLHGMGFDETTLFPNLDVIAEDVKRFATTGRPKVPTSR
jgi:FRG domain